MTLTGKPVYCNDNSADWKPGADSDDEKPKVKKPTVASLKQQLRKRDAEIGELQQENKRLKCDLARATGAPQAAAAAVAKPVKKKVVKPMDPIKLQGKADRLRKKIAKQLEAQMKYEYKVTDRKPRSMATQEMDVPEEVAEAIMGGEWNKSKAQESRMMSLPVYGKPLRFSGELKPVGDFSVQYIRP